jgi:hypothetical protein
MSSQVHSFPNRGDNEFNLALRGDLDLNLNGAGGSRRPIGDMLVESGFPRGREHPETTASAARIATT